MNKTIVPLSSSLLHTGISSIKSYEEIKVNKYSKLVIIIQVITFLKRP